MQWCRDLATEKFGNLTLVYDERVSPAVIDEIQRTAFECFATCRALKVPAKTKWPDGPNWMFKHAAKAHREPFLWMEPDAIPLKPGWLEAVAEEYAQCGKAFMGYRYECHNPRFPQFALSGIAVYPANAIELVPLLENSPMAWEIEAAEIMVAQGAHTPLIQHFWGEPGLAPTFTEENSMNRPRNGFALSQIPDQAMIWHRCKDGSLIRLLRRQMGIAVQETETADVVSLRRNGDIVCLLPVLRRESKRLNRPIRLVVHNEFMPLLDGVSYVEGVPWHGDWESPLDAAARFKARNAQVFGRGLQPDTMHGNFAKIAWSHLGRDWDRHAPLVFDQRDEEREAALRRAVFKTDRPKILVKIHGFSSPFPHGDMVRQMIIQRFAGQAEIVNLDEVKAERLFDLLGLLDHAACLVSIDTVTLWLASATKCPVISLTNGSGFGASPPRGNVVARVPYSDVPNRINGMGTIIGHTLRKCPTDSITLTFQYFRTADPSTQARNDAAYATWPKLRAELAPYEPGRTSKAMGDTRAMPYLRDMILHALTATQSSIIALINNDIILLDGIDQAVRESCDKYGCYWSYRLFDDSGNTDDGADFFAFTRCWWDLHQHYFPDFLLGYWGWDDVLVRMMRWSGCREQRRLTFHRPHPTTQSPTRLHAPGHHYNMQLFDKWLHLHHELREKPKDE